MVVLRTLAFAVGRRPMPSTPTTGGRVDHWDDLIRDPDDETPIMAVRGSPPVGPESAEEVPARFVEFRVPADAGSLGTEILKSCPAGPDDGGMGVAELLSVPLWLVSWKPRGPVPVIVNVPDDDVLLRHLDEDGWD